MYVYLNCRPCDYLRQERDSLQQQLNDYGMPTPIIRGVESYKDGMSVLIDSDALYNWKNSIRNGFFAMQTI